ncbi:unnamed protein product [Caretta caretta]
MPLFGECKLARRDMKWNMSAFELRPAALQDSVNEGHCIQLKLQRNLRLQTLWGSDCLLLCVYTASSINGATISAQISVRSVDTACANWWEAKERGQSNLMQSMEEVKVFV